MVLRKKESLMRRDDRQRFEQGASEIIWEWAKRKKLAADQDPESPNAWFKRQAYAFLREYVLKGEQSLLESVVRGDRRPKRLVEDALQNPFKLGLMAMTVDESISRSDRHVFGNQMLYAHLHDVPPEFLNGFIAVSGKPAVIAEKLKSGFVEPGLEERARRMGRSTPKVAVAKISRRRGN